MRQPRLLRTEPRAGQAGFSLLEAVVVLAVAGMALMLIFAVATRATQSGFRLGRLALDTADSEVADDAFRVLVAGLVIAPWPSEPEEFERAGFSGGPQAFQGPAVLARGGPCAPAGPALVRVEIVRRGDGDQVVCRAGATRAVLFTAPARVNFAYSEDGRRWSTAWTDAPAFGAQATSLPPRSRRLYIRLTDQRGGLDIVAATPRERPIASGQAGGPDL